MRLDKNNVNMNQYPFPLSPFLENLANSGLSISVRDYRRISRVLSTSGDWDLDRLQAVLCSLLVDSHEQRLVFEQQFKQYFDADLNLNLSENVDIHRWNEELVQLLNTLDNQTEKEVTTRIPHTQPKLPNNNEAWTYKPRFYQRKIVWLTLGALFITLLTLWCVLRGHCFSPPIEQPEPSYDTSVPEVTPPPITEDSEPNTTRLYPNSLTIVDVVTRLHPRFSIHSLWQPLAIGSTLLAALFFFLWWRKRRPPPSHKLYSVDPHLSERHFDEGWIGGDLAPWLSSAEADYLAELLVYTKSESDSQQLDMAASIEASAAQGGIPTPRFYKQQQLQQLLILDGSQGLCRSWNSLSKELVNSLQQRGIKLTNGTYHQSPDQFVDSMGQRQHLSDWDQQHPQLLLIIFADTQGQQGILEFDWQQWPEALLFSYHEPRFWDEREQRLLSQGVKLHHANVAQLLTEVEQQQSETPSVTQQQQVQYPYDYFVQGLDERDIDYIARVLGPALPWAEVCSLYAGGLSFAAIERLRQRYFKQVPREQTQRLLRLSGSGCRRRSMDFSPRMVIALRQRFAKRDQAWRQTMLTGWYELLNEVEPKAQQSLEWQFWQWQKLRLGMHEDTDHSLQELYDLYQSSPALQDAIQAELKRGDVRHGVDAIPLALPDSLVAKKQLYAMTEADTGLQKIQAYPHAGWQRWGAIISTLFALVWLGLGVWQMIKLPQAPELIFPVGGSEKWQALTEWEITTEGYQLHLLNMAQDQHVLKGDINKAQLPATLTLATEAVERPCQKMIQPSSTVLAEIQLYRCAVLTNQDKPLTSWQQAVKQRNPQGLPHRRQLSIAIVLHQANQASSMLKESLLKHNSVDWVMDITLLEGMAVNENNLYQRLQQQLGLWLAKTQILLIQDKHYELTQLTDKLSKTRLVILQGDFDHLASIFVTEQDQPLLDEKGLQQMAEKASITMQAKGEAPAAIYPVDMRAVAGATVAIVEPEMVKIPQGSFKMGCVSDKDCYDDEKPVHKVTVATFEMGKYEVTNQQYATFLKAIQWRGTKEQPWFNTKEENSYSHLIENQGNYQVEEGFEDHPVINVSWYGANAYLQWLSEQTGKAYRLPTEAEWEYAARAGTTTPYWWGDKASHRKANYDDDGLIKGKDQWPETSPVNSFSANPWGLHDMAGNVYDWVADCYHDNYKNAPKEGRAWLEDCNNKKAAVRILRGGSWGSIPINLRSAYRAYDDADVRSGSAGFRAARTR